MTESSDPRIAPDICNSCGAVCDAENIPSDECCSCFGLNIHNFCPSCYSAYKVEEDKYYDEIAISDWDGGDDA